MLRGSCRVKWLFLPGSRRGRGLLGAGSWWHQFPCAEGEGVRQRSAEGGDGESDLRHPRGAHARQWGAGGHNLSLPSPSPLPWAAPQLPGFPWGGTTRLRVVLPEGRAGVTPRPPAVPRGGSGTVHPVAALPSRVPVEPRFLLPGTSMVPDTQYGDGWVMGEDHGGGGWGVERVPQAGRDAGAALGHRLDQRSLPALFSAV